MASPKNLKELNPSPYSSKEQIQPAFQLATKLSIQGVQPKLSLLLNSTQKLEIVEEGKNIS